MVSLGVGGSEHAALTGKLTGWLGASLGLMVTSCGKTLGVTKRKARLELRRDLQLARDRTSKAPGPTQARFG